MTYRVYCELIWPLYTQVREVRLAERVGVLKLVKRAPHDAHDGCRNARVRAQLHDKVECEPIVRAAEEREEEVLLAVDHRQRGLARVVSVDVQRNVGPRACEDAPDEV